MVTYFNNVRFNSMPSYSDSLIENGNSQNARREINLMMHKARTFVRGARIGYTVTWTAPPLVGGRSHRVDLLGDLFGLYRYEITPKYVTDLLERAIGVYQADRQNALIRSVNPFWWLMKVLLELARVPFRILGAVGFDEERTERSLLGRITKAVIVAIPVIASVLAIAESLGGLGWLRGVLGI